MSEFAPNIALRAYQLWDAAEGPKEGAMSFTSKRRKSFASCWKQRKKIPLTLEKRRFFLRQTIRSVGLS
jgi:hypothetical protein